MFLAAPAGLLADSVIIESGETVKGEITRETVKGINIANRSLAKPQVVAEAIVYEKKPEQLTKAQDALRSRDWKTAHQGFRAVIQLCESAMGGAEPKTNGKGAAKKPAAPKPAPKSAIAIRSIFLQHALWGEVLTSSGEGDSSKTLTAINNLLSRYPDSWYLQEALILKVRLAGDDAAAFGTAADEAIKLAAAAGAGAEIEDRIKLLKAENFARQGKAAGYEDLTRSSVRQVAEAAKLALAKAMLEKDPVQAKITFKELLRASKDRAVLCGAAQGLGEAQLKEMKGDRTIDGLREALESYLKAEVLYPPAQGDPTEAHEAALFSAAQCAEEIMKMAAKDKKLAKVQEGFRTVARELYKEITQVYRGSERAKKADVALRQLQAQAP